MFEQRLNDSFFQPQQDKSFIDKVLARKDVENIREIIKKPRLNRSDLTDLLHLLSSVEVKLLNYGEWDRYVILKFFVWIREFVAVMEHIYDYKDDLKIKRNTCASCLRLIESDKLDSKVLCQCETNPDKIYLLKKLNSQIIRLKLKKPLYKYRTAKIKLNKRTRQLFENNMRLMEHNVKFLVDLYFNIGRTTLSLGATGMLEILKNKYEVSYPGYGGLIRL